MSMINTRLDTKNGNIVESASIIKNSIQTNGSNLNKESPVTKNEITDEFGNPTKVAFQIAVNKMNEFMETTNKNSKFVFHDGLEKYYVEIVDAITEEVVKEIPPKELLDAYYEMQKMIGKIVDKSV